MLRMLLRRKTSYFSLSIITVLLVAALLAPVVATHDYAEQDLERKLLPPSRAHLFGTDEFGRDVFSRVVWGARVSLEIGIIATGVALAIGFALGLVAGFYGGYVDLITQAAVDITWAFPTLLIALVLITFLGPGLVNVMVAVGLAYWSQYARVVRGQVLSVREEAFVEAARALGAGDGRILLRHVLPNVFAPTLVLATLSMGSAITIESMLSFIGVGAQPPTPSWGSMVSSGRIHIMDAPWVCLFPGMAITFTVLAFNLLGDNLRDILDPNAKL